MRQKQPLQNRLVAGFLGVPLLVVLSPLIVISVLSWLLYRISLNLLIWCFWYPQGKFVLFVHSDSPVSQAYLQKNLLPIVKEHAVVLNWSERKQWSRRSLAVRAFYSFGGRYDYNPLVVVFRPLRTARVFRFHRPFRDYKHGKPEQLERMSRELAQLVEQISGEAIA